MNSGFRPRLSSSVSRCPGVFSEHVLDHQGVDVDEGGLEEMQGEDGKFLLVAAVAVLSPCSTDNTIFSFTSTGCFDGLATMVLLTIGGSRAGSRTWILRTTAHLFVRVRFLTGGIT